jgi:hypothetical protein
MRAVASLTALVACLLHSRLSVAQLHKHAALICLASITIGCNKALEPQLKTLMG